MAQIFVSGVAHFFVVVGGSKIHERMAHFFIDIYTVSYERNGSTHFWLKRLVNVYIPFLFAMLLQTMLRTYLFQLQLKCNVITLSLSVFGIQPNNIVDSSMWYIPYITMCYAVFYISHRIAEKSGVFFLIFALLWCVVFDISKLPAFSMAGARYYVWAFPLGVILARYRNELSFSVKNSAASIGVVCYLLIWNVFLFVCNRMGISRESAFDFLFVAFAMMLTLISKVFFSKIVAWIGRKSYSIYLCEMFSLECANQFFGDNEATRLLSFVIITIVFSLVLEWINKHIKKMMDTLKDVRTDRGR